MTEPIYRRIAHDLRRRIRSGDLPPGHQLPPEPELKKLYNASRNTVRDAIKWLATNGLVETRPGQGTFVRDRINPFVTTLSPDPETGLGGGEGEAAFTEVRERGRAPSRSAPKVELQAATGNIAARLRIPEGTQVLSRLQERFIDGTPWSLLTTFYPMDLVRQGATLLLVPDEIPGGSVRYLRKTLNLVQVGYRDRILVRAPDENEALFFGLPDDGRISMISLIRTGYRADDDGPVPFRVTFTVLPADRNQLVINSGEVPAARAAAAAPPVPLQRLYVRSRALKRPSSGAEAPDSAPLSPAPAS
ncbi:MAG: GntR family transcriptional regulator [Streptosporangiaceae bacterium]|nr:GntR family transcriptional regulator [Streptosporangiaceae bacterium]